MQTAHFPLPWPLQAGDAQIQTSVERMQRVIELARAIRERHGRGVKMPVREVVVVHPDQSFLDDLTGEVALSWR